jgi:ATP-dependent Lhr-like helicase
VLDRLEHLTGRPLQRVGLSATVGNPDHLMTWLQGPHAGVRPTELVAGSGGVAAPSVVSAVAPLVDVTLDHVGGIAGAATVIAALHAGEKRLVFCETRRAAEALALELRERGVQTFVSHSSLSRDERRQSEQAFAEARDCVIVATSTLELGVDVGDLDRMIQIDAPRTVASFLQRLGRTGRRADTHRKALLLTTRPDSLLQAAGLLLLWSRGFVESITAPPQPLHIAAQQILAICLERRVTRSELLERWGVHALAGGRAAELLARLESDGHLARDGAQVFVGPETERQFGRRHFLELLSVFTAAPEFTVNHGREELGTVDPFVLTRKVEGARVVVLAGRSWRVTHVDWRRHRCYVEEWDQGAPMRWSGDTPPLSFELCRAQRDVVLGIDPPVTLSRRAVEALASVREEHLSHARPTPLVVHDDVWWTWARARANATLIASLRSAVDPLQRVDNLRIRLRDGMSRAEFTDARRTVHGLFPPGVSDAAIDGLKFSELLTDADAADPISARMTDEVGANTVLASPTAFL